MSKVTEWKWIRLGDACNFIGGGTPSKEQKQFWGGDIPWASVKDVKGEFLNSTQNTITKIGLESSASNVAEQGDVILITRISPGKTIISNIRTAINQDLKVAKPKFKTTSKFMSYYFRAFEREIVKKSSGTTVLGITLNNLNELPIPVLDFETQQAIVSKIEELFSEVDKGIENLRIAQQQLKTYRQSVLKWAFEGKLTEEWRKKNTKKVKGTVPKVGTQPNGGLPERWEWVKITDLVPKDKHSLKAGPFGSSLKKEHYVSKGYKVYGQEQVISGDPYFGDYYIDKEKYKELFTNRIKPFDILISLVGTVGKVLILPANCDEGIINPRLIKVSLDRNVYLSSFFKYYFESSKVKSFYSGETRGTTMDVLNLGIIKTIDFPLCSIQEQQAIVEEIESRLSVADKMEESIATSLQQADALKQSILKMAFEGRLVSAVKPASDKDADMDYLYKVQMMALIAKISKKKGIAHGEMTIAKYEYLLQEVFGIPTGFKFERWHLGPYTIEMKKVVNNSAYFKKEDHSIEVVDHKIVSGLEKARRKSIESAVNELATIFLNYPAKTRAHKTELLATVCKVIEDIKSTDLAAVRESMEEWKINLPTTKLKNKAEKFTEAETKKCLAFIIGKGWDKKLI